MVEKIDDMGKEPSKWEERLILLFVCARKLRYRLRPVTTDWNFEWTGTRKDG